MAVSCGIYSFTGSSIPIGVETFQVDYFENTAGGKPGSTIEPGLDRDFTIALQDLIVNQTSLNLVNEGGDIIYSGEIVEYSVHGFDLIAVTKSWWKTHQPRKKNKRNSH